jgi:phospholipid/cholesterol/gamma-HCH transport system permease protein
VVIEWWRLVHLGALILVLTLSPSSYSPQSRAILARHIYINTAPIFCGSRCCAPW